MDRLLQREGERDRGRSPRLDHSAGQQDGEWGRGVSGRKTSPHKERAPASAVAVHARTSSSDGRREGEAGDKCMHAARDCGDGPPGQVQDGRSVHRARPTSASTTARRYHSLQFQADSLSSRARKEAERVGTGGGSGGAASIISGKSGMVSSGKEKAPIKTASSSPTIAGSRRVASATRVPLRQLQTSAAEQVARVIEKEELAGLRGKSYRGTPVPSSLVDEITPLSTQEEFQLSLESRQGRDAKKKNVCVCVCVCVWFELSLESRQVKATLPCLSLQSIWHFHSCSVIFTCADEPLLTCSR